MQAATPASSVASWIHAAAPLGRRRLCALADSSFFAGTAAAEFELSEGELDVLAPLIEESGFPQPCDADPASIGHDDCVAAVEDPRAFVAAANAAWQRKPREPGPVALPERNAVLASHVAALLLYDRLLARARAGRGRMGAVAMPAAHPPGPVPPLEAHSAISLAECATRAEGTWPGRALFVRTVAPALRWVATRTLVEDDDDAEVAVLPLSLYNLVPPAMDPQLFLPEGTHLALLEPCARGEGATLRCAALRSPSPPLSHTDELAASLTIF